MNSQRRGGCARASACYQRTDTRLVGELRRGCWVIGLQPIRGAWSRRVFRRWLVVPIVVALVALGAATAPRPAAAAARTLAVTPATGLKDQVVKVQWTGFTPST